MIQKSIVREPVPSRTVNLNVNGGFVLTCEHASNELPGGYGSLGLEPDQLESHIAWDPGADGVARALSHELRSPLVLGRFSRLLIDLNRPLHRPSSIATHSDGQVIPGNCELDSNEQEHRQVRYFEPFHAAVKSAIDGALNDRISPIVVAVHSFEPSLNGQRRPWEIGIVYRRSKALARHLVEWFNGRDVRNVGDNAPYRIDEDDYTIPTHGEARELDAVLIEIRNDLIHEVEAQVRWANEIAQGLRSFEASLTSRGTSK